MQQLYRILAPALAVTLAAPPGFAANHREAPITAFDHKADITDVFAFRSYDGGSTPRVTMILCVDPLLDPANGPNWWPFDPDILYEIKVDNNNDAVEDIVFQFRFSTNSGCRICFRSTPAPEAASMRPPTRPRRFHRNADRAAENHVVQRHRAGSAAVLHCDDGEGQRVLTDHRIGTVLRCAGQCRTAHDGLHRAVQRATYSTNTPNVKVFAGTVDDPFWIDLGATFDTLNLRAAIAPGVLSPAQDAALANIASDTYPATR